MKLSDRIYHCNVCGLTIDRDLNAAINILHMGLIKVGKNVGRGAPELTPVESATAAELSKGEVYELSLCEAGTPDALARGVCQSYTSTACFVRTGESECAGCWP